MTKEIWKTILGYEGLYEVSNLGRVRSVDRVVPCKYFSITKKGAIKTLLLNKRGYQYVFLSKKGIEKTHRVHRLVAEAFIPNPGNKPEIDHINTIKTDNSVDNLRWVTSQENSENEISHKKQKDAWTEELKHRVMESRRANGGKHAPKRVYQYTLDGDFVATYNTINEAKIALGTNNNICRAVDNEERSACGYLWRSNYVEKPTYRGRMKLFRLQNIAQYDKDGHVVARYKDIKDASEQTGIHPALIRRSIYKDYVPRKYKFKLEDVT